MRPAETLLDRSYHHAAMKGLEGAEKRGRPDIVHFALMEALSTPLYLSGMLNVYVHTATDKVVSIGPDLRLPKSYFRFEGLMMDLFRHKVVEADGNVLLKLHDMPLVSLINSIGAVQVLGLSTAGTRTTAEDVAGRLAAGEEEDSAGKSGCAVVVGGFPRGHFSEKTSSKFNFTFSISDYGLEAHVVIARVIYECEKALEVDEAE